MYRLRGKAVSIGGMAEWVIRRLVWEFSGQFTHPNVGRCWDQLKSELSDRDLTDSLQPELAAVAAMFKARHRAAHVGALLIGPGSWQLARFEFGDPTMRRVSGEMHDLARETADVRAGYGAVRSIARALVADEPGVIDPADKGSLVVMLLLDELPEDD